MRSLVHALSLVMVLLVGAALAAIPEQEPNDDFAAPEFAGDLGFVGETPVVVDGTVASYGLEGDRDVYRFSVDAASRVSVIVEGFSGQMDARILDATGEEVAVTPLVDWGFIYFAAVELGAGDWMVDLSGAIGPISDPYLLTIRRIADSALFIQKAEVKFNASKPDRDTGSATATFALAGLDPAANGLFLRYFSREWFVAPERFKTKKLKQIFKGDKGDLLKKVQFDFGKGVVKVKLGKGSLGVPGQGGGEVELYLESNGVGLGQTVVATPNKSGRVLRYKAPK